MRKSPTLSSLWDSAICKFKNQITKCDTLASASYICGDVCSLPLIAVAYLDGTLAIYDLSTQVLRHRCQHEVSVLLFYFSSLRWKSPRCHLFLPLPGWDCSPAVGGVFVCGVHLQFGRSAAFMGRPFWQLVIRVPRPHRGDPQLHRQQVRLLKWPLFRFGDTLWSG